MIRGGSEYGLGIYVTGVDRSSAADSAGLRVRTTKKFTSNILPSLYLTKELFSMVGSG